MLTYITTRCPKPQVEQTRITRISKKIEASKDKTKTWLPARPSFNPPSSNREDMQRMHTGQAPPPDNLASRSLLMRWCCRCPVMETPALELASEGVFPRVLEAPIQLFSSRASAIRMPAVVATPATTVAPLPTRISSSLFCTPSRVRSPSITVLSKRPADEQTRSQLSSCFQRSIITPNSAPGLVAPTSLEAKAKIPQLLLAFEVSSWMVPLVPSQTLGSCLNERH